MFCSPDRSVIVWDEQTISMSSRFAQGFLRCGGVDYYPGDPITVTSSVSCTLFLFDINDNALPFETAVFVEATTGLTVGSTTFVIGDGIFPSATSVVVSQSNPMTPVSGTLTVTTTTPKKNATTMSWEVSP